MIKYDFDAVIDRKHTNCLKYDFAVERGRPADVLPLWVADMDFQAPEPVLQALHNAVTHGIFGYSDTKADYYQAVSAWFLRHFSWQTQEKWLVKTPGVVYAIAMAVRTLTKPGDCVLIQPPVYYPFFSVIEDNQRIVVENQLLYQEGRYDIDFEDFERKIVENNIRLFILCSPHNPVGRVWTTSELQRIGDICHKHQVFVVSDEIHCDFAFAQHPHSVFTQAVPEMENSAIICTAPSKSFNLAGLQVSNIGIANEKVRRAFVKEMDCSGYSQLNSLGLVACQAAYAQGEEWLIQCRAYMQENLDFVRAFLKEHLPQIRLVEPNGTYFAWLDCTALGKSQEELDFLVLHKAKLWLDAGHIFGGQAGKFQRVVLACPRKVLEQALLQLANALAD